jgi:hypothetical protein
VGLFLRPRRPLLRLATGAATATVAYRAGQRRAQQDVYNEQAEAAYAATQPQPQPQPPAAPAYAAPVQAPAGDTDTIAELERLSRLHESGALSAEEFASAKARVLGL